MTLRIGEISRWHKFDKAAVLNLPAWAGATAPRLIRINVNSPNVARFYLVDGHGQLGQFLAVTQGLETVEFSALGDVRITHDADDVYVQTSEKEPTFAQATGETFTTIHERAQRNPELEAVMFQMMRNVDRRFSQLEAEAQRREAKAYDAGKANAADAAARQPVASAPKRDGDGSAPGSSDPKAASEPKAGAAAGGSAGAADDPAGNGGVGGSGVAAKPKA